MTLWKLKWYYERFCKLLIRCPGCPLPHHFLVIALVWGKTQLDTVFYRLAYMYVYSESISRILYWFSFVESIESLCTVCVVETDRKIFNSAKNLVIVCGGVFCGDTGWWKFFWCLWKKIKPQRKKQSIKHHRY